MKKLLLSLLLMSGIVAHAWDSSSAYNTIAMSYTANSTVTQVVVLDNSQRANGTNLTFKVDVKNGGGRPTHDLNGVAQAYSTQTDSASITIYTYDSTGALISSATSPTYTLYNYGSNAGWSSGPGDNLHPFTQASVTYTGSLANVAYVKVEMKGTDGAWWAGNYGAQWRTPTLNVGSDPTNLVYNSEFGLASNGVKAQGWSANNGQGWSNCGVTSGSLICVTQESGVTANMWGGGEDLNGGTTSGQAGGYSGTLTSDNATSAASGTITPGGGGTTAPTGPSVDGGTIAQTNSSGNDVITSGASSTAGINATKQTSVNNWNNSTSAKNNEIYVQQSYGNNNNITMTQEGTKNKIEFTLNGNGNSVNSSQLGSNYMKQDVPGWGNNITTTQSNTNGNNYLETRIQGNGNTVNHSQTGNHILFSNSSGDINSINSTQSGTAQHTLEIKSTGNWNSVISSQTGNSQNKANVDLTNAGGAATVDVQQTGGKSFTIIHSCANALGCSTTIRQ